MQMVLNLPGEKDSIEAIARSVWRERYHEEMPEFFRIVKIEFQRDVTGAGTALATFGSVSPPKA